MSYRYGPEDLKKDMDQIIHVFACGDGGPALVSFRVRMEGIVQEMHDNPSAAAPETLVQLFRQFAKLTATIGGKCDD